MLITSNTNWTDSYPGILSLSRAQEISWQYFSFDQLFYRKKGRWVPLTVACEEAHCERSCVSGTRKCRATVALEMESSLLDTGSNSPER